MESDRYGRIVLESVKRILAERGEPTPYSILINSYSLIYQELKKNGYLLSAPENVEDVLKKAVGKELVLVPVRNPKGKVIGKKWWFKDPSTVPYIEQVPLKERVEVAVVGVLNRKIVASFDDIQKEIFVKFPNSMIPDTESIRKILEEYASHTKDGRWRLKPAVQTRERQHDTIIELLCQIGEKAGYEVYGDTPSRRGKLDLDIPEPKLGRIKEIDAIWYRRGKIEYSFEVENTTGITEGIVRAGNIPYSNARFVLIPDERENLLARKVNEPAMKDMIEKEGWRFIRYDDFFSFANGMKKRASVDPTALESISKDMPKAVRSTTIDEFSG